MLAEFALIAPILLSLVFGIIEFGVAYGQAGAVEAAASEAGRLASLSTTTATDVSDRVDVTLAGIVPAGTQVVVQVLPGPCAGRRGESVTVTVTVPHRVTIPLVTDRTIPLRARAVFRCEA